MSRRIHPLIALILIVLPSALHAAVRTAICPVIGGGFASRATGECFTGGSCSIGVRGDWVDITHEVLVSGASVKILERGTGQARIGQCLPITSKKAEGYITLELSGFQRTGDHKVRLNRAGGSDEFDVTVGDGTTYLGLDIQPPRARTVEVGTATIFTLRGKNLDKLRIKLDVSVGNVSRPAMPATQPSGQRVPLPPSEPDEILSRTETTASVRLTFYERGRKSLEEKLMFEGGEPELNRRFGWPEVEVRAATAPPPSLPNLVPERPAPNQLLRNARVQLPMTFCGNLPPGGQGAQPVPAFEWSIRNNSSFDVSQPFQAELMTRDGTVLARENVNGLRARETARFRSNWPGRQAMLVVRNFNEPPRQGGGGPTVGLPGGGDSKDGCHVVDFANITLDPDPLIIVVDRARAVDESNDTDNDLRF